MAKAGREEIAVHSHKMLFESRHFTSSAGPAMFPAMPVCLMLLFFCEATLFDGRKYPLV